MPAAEARKLAPKPCLRRLPTYLRVLRRLEVEGRLTVSCTAIGEELGLGFTQVRKDLACTGIVGTPRVGYRVVELIAAIQRCLGWHRATDALLAGAGNLGKALLAYEGFAQYRLRIVAAFDVDPSLVGTEVAGCPVRHLDDLPNAARSSGALVGILTVPADQAQSVTCTMVLSGIKAIWNFTGARLEIPRGVLVEDVDLAASLAVLTNRLEHVLTD